MSVPASHSILIHSEGRAAPDINTAFLRQPNIQMTTTAGTEDVLEDVRRDIPDLIIEELDPAAPNGEPLCAELKANTTTQGIPVILVVPAERRRQAGRAKPDALLVKPVVPRELFEAVNQFVPLPARRALRYEVNLRFGFEYGGRAMQAFTRNLSLNGAFVKTDRAIPKGSHLQIRFIIPGDHREIRCGGVVRQTLGDVAGPRQCRGLGVEFEEISDADLERLEAYISSRSRRRYFRR